MRAAITVSGKHDRYLQQQHSSATFWLQSQPRVIDPVQSIKSSCVMCLLTEVQERELYNICPQLQKLRWLYWSLAPMLYKLFVQLIKMSNWFVPGAKAAGNWTPWICLTWKLEGLAQLKPPMKKTVSTLICSSLLSSFLRRISQYGMRQMLPNQPKFTWVWCTGKHFHTLQTMSDYEPSQTWYYIQCCVKCCNYRCCALQLINHLIVGFFYAYLELDLMPGSLKLSERQHFTSAGHHIYPHF